jgi:Protein of unknown function (DUF2958)
MTFATPFLIASHWLRRERCSRQIQWSIFKMENIMPLITEEQRERLLHNGRFNSFRRGRGEFEIDFKPVVKLYVPAEPWVWLLGELSPDDGDQVYGLWDVGRGPQLGWASLQELDLIRDIQRDDRFVPVKSLREYFEEARLGAEGGAA